MKESDKMKKHQAKKRFGQNFLTDTNLLNKIVKDAKVLNKDVIEIGPGMGALTKQLLEVANSVTAYEIDYDLKPILKKLKDEYSNFEVKFEDFLKVDIPNDKTYDVVANIPYNITSPIIFKILETENINAATLMVQKEVSDRITSLPGNKTYNALTVIVNYYMNVEKIVNVGRKLFRPIPKVDSAVFRMERKARVFDGVDEKEFIEMLKASFHQKRKTLANNLHFYYRVPKREVNEILENLKININERAENIDLDHFVKIFKKLKKL